jgi:hypothetical protein
MSNKDSGTVLRVIHSDISQGNVLKHPVLHTVAKRLFA